MSVGRPRSFDIDTALDAALNVFWRNGFEGTSMPDLTAAMGINRPSLYAAFGNKESLFRRAIERYEAKHAERFQRALDQLDVRVAMETLLRGNIELFSDPKSPPGCFMVQGALACGSDAEQIKSDLAKRRSEFTAALRARFARAIESGDLPADADAGDLAWYITAISHGIAVQAAGGAKRAQLLRVVQTALRALPTKTETRGGPASRTKPKSK